jgi:MFS family permease
MTRKIIAVLLGIITAFASVAGIESLGHTIYPPPIGLDMNDTEQMAEYMQLVPLGALLAVLAAWTIATLVGGVVAGKIADEKPLVFASIIGSLMMAASVSTLIMIPHPTWFSITAIVLIVLATLLASRLSRS